MTKESAEIYEEFSKKLKEKVEKEPINSEMILAIEAYINLLKSIR